MTTTTQDRHTPEPWLAQHSQICKGSLAVSDCFRAEDGSPEANARRIVACVNACAGYSTDALESGISVVRTAQKNMEARALAEAQRDELAAALRGFVDSTLYGAAHDTGRAHEFRPLFDAARAILAKVQS